jgi:hypothetical protein
MLAIVGSLGEAASPGLSQLYLTIELCRPDFWVGTSDWLAGIIKQNHFPI